VISCTRQEHCMLNMSFNHGILYSDAIWRKLSNNNQHCSITA